MRKYLKKYWLYCLLAPLFMMGELTMDLLQPDMMATIVDDGVLGGDLQVILQVGLRMVLLVIFGGTCGVLCGVFANIAAQRFGNDVRKDLFAHIMDFSFSQTDRFTTGSLVTRITNDVTQVEQLVMMSVRSLVRCMVMFIGGIYMLHRQSPRFSLIALCGLPFITAFVIFFLKKVSPLYTIIQKKLDRINCIMQENIAGARVVRAYVKEEDELAHFSEANDSLCDTNLRAQTTLAFLNPCVNIVLNLCVVAVLYVGGITVQADGNITPGQIMASITYLSLILMRIVFMANIFQTFTRAWASWLRIREVLQTENEQQIMDAGEQQSDAHMRGEVEFRNVSFAYPDAPESPVLENISFSVKQGESIAVIGSTGSGKSSLVQLIPRFYDATAGEVLVDGQDVKTFSMKELRDKIGIVQQKAELFSCSIRENICWGVEYDGEMEPLQETQTSHVTESDVRRAAQVAQAEEFILRMPDGYETKVTESGHSLSGGQKQRISIARAIIRNPEILIFDDSGSALDLKTEAALYEALNKEFADTTKIIVAQRIASARQADRILVLDNGKVCALGTHEELLKNSGVYREICRSQLKKGAIAE